MSPRLIALIALLFVVGTACDQSGQLDQTPTAAVTVTVALTASEVGASTLQYSVSHPTALSAPLQGTVGVTDPATSFRLTQLPVATGYSLTMFAYKAGATDPFCEGSATFDIEKDTTTFVSTTLTCPTSDPTETGEIGVDITFQLNFCPEIEQVSADPATTVLADPVTLQAAATDPDNTAPVTYLWTATGGTIADGTAATTTFMCPAVGDYTVTLRISDSDTRCDQLRQADVHCMPNALCGNGVREVTELCDDGTNDGGDLECLNCNEFQVCLNGVVQGTEQCDDSGWSAACDVDCTVAECGDGLQNVAAGEVCDDGGETARCDSNCTAAYCGDGTLNITAGEICDSGGQTPTCNANCTLAGCGDLFINVTAGEQCDDGGETATCDADCTAARCGDSTLNPTAGEECDTGGESATCDVDCTFVVCGDAVLNTTAGEICDDGVNDGTGPGLCEPGCGAPATCGNFSIETFEDCDEGGTATATCDANCTFAVCGDATFNAAAGEECDAGGESAACDVDCTEVICGDGLRNATAGEACDTGGESATCDVDCSLPQCGDGLRNQSAGEQCDTGGESASCDIDCTTPVCGDAVLNVTAGEICDDGVETATCDADCTPPVCGDGLLNVSAGEVCDDGVNDGTGPGMCEPGCGAPAQCGNGLNETTEECDDAGESATCDTDCTLAMCGDGTLNVTSGEVCDGGGQTAACDADCTPAACGDGTVNTAAGETCDTAGESATCDVDCTAVLCGDGLPPLGDLLAEPHDKGGAGGQGDDGHQDETDPGLGTTSSPAGPAHGLQADGDAGPLDDREDNRAVAGPLGDGLLPLRPLLGEPLHRLEDHGRGAAG